MSTHRSLRHGKASSLSPTTVPTERQLSDVLSEFARTMLTEFPIQGILDRLVRRIVEIMPVTGAGVTLISESTSPHYVAASDDAAFAYEQLQTALDEGPCVVAYRTGASVASADLRREGRHPARVREFRHIGDDRFPFRRPEPSLESGDAI